VLALGVGGFATFNAFVPAHATDIGLSGSKWVFALYSVVCLVFRIFGARLQSPEARAAMGAFFQRRKG
jgi:hypothetical protein